MPDWDLATSIPKTLLQLSQIFSLELTLQEQFVHHYHFLRLQCHPHTKKSLTSSIENRVVNSTSTKNHLTESTKPCPRRLLQTISIFLQTKNSPWATKPGAPCQNAFWMSSWWRCQVEEEVKQKQFWLLVRMSLSNLYHRPGCSLWPLGEPSTSVMSQDTYIG
jgi:hypothetical protein